jgi:DNA-binding GntR family transcriptional regulator
VAYRGCAGGPGVLKEYGITLYEKTIEYIRKLIADRELLAGDRLPSEIEIAGMAGVSLMTVRRAMSELAAEGTLQRVQGRGTFVRSNRIQTESTIIGGLKQTLALQGIDLTTQLVSLKVTTADVQCAKRLSIAVGTAVWNVVRVRRLDGVAAVREVAVIPCILAPDLDEHFASTSESLYETLARHYGLAESLEEQSLVARRATPIECADLGLDETGFVVEVTGVSMTINGVAFDSFTMVFVSHMFAFRLRSTPSADPVELNGANDMFAEHA